MNYRSFFFLRVRNKTLHNAFFAPFSEECFTICLTMFYIIETGSHFVQAPRFRIFRGLRASGIHLHHLLPVQLSGSPPAKFPSRWPGPRCPPGRKAWGRGRTGNSRRRARCSAGFRPEIGGGRRLFKKQQNPVIPQRRKPKMSYLCPKERNERTTWRKF